jgi:hypothetical protein
MSRERTTWSREEIAKRAAEAGKTADDPRAMNQDHHSQQPADDKYVTGGPSEFAEDVTPPNWKVEQSGGETKRNEIGMPAMLPDTFKTAGLDEETLTKKADVCIRVARQMLGGAAESAIEDQAYALMHLPDVELIQTADRLAKGKVPPEFLEQQQKMKDKAKGKSDDEGDDKDQGQQGQGQGQGQQQKKQAGDDEDKQSEEDEGQDKQAAKKSEDEEVDVEEVEQQKQAAYKVAAEALQAGNVEGFQGAINDIVACTFKLAAQQQQDKQQDKQSEEDEGGDEGQDKQAGQGCMTAQQVEQMIQQAIESKTMGQQQPQMPQQLSDDQLLDQMLQDQGQVQQLPEVDVQLEGAPMDIGETPLGPEDEVLGQLFASNKEVQQAAQAQALQDGVPAPAATPPIKTASTRTVGTRPTGGVSQIGGSGSADTPASGDVDKLSGLWRSAPDVSGVFNPEG